MRSAGNFSPEWGYLAPVPSFMRTVRVVLVATAVGATAGAAVVLSLVERPAAQGDKTAVAAHPIVTSAQAAPATAMPPTTATPLAAAPVASPSVTAAKVSVSGGVPANAEVTATAQPQIPAKATTQTPVQVAPQLLAPQLQAQRPPSPALATQSAATNAPSENLVTSEVNPPPATPPVSGIAVSGIAALSAAPPVSEAVSSDLTDTPIIEPERVPPQKKTKHATAGANPVDTKTKTKPGLGSVLRNLFSAGTSTRGL
jgi:hypothetical protein